MERQLHAAKRSVQDMEAMADQFEDIRDMLKVENSLCIPTSVRVGLCIGVTGVRSADATPADHLPARRRCLERKWRALRIPNS
jgi:hypothetical protein